MKISRLRMASTAATLAALFALTGPAPAAHATTITPTTFVDDNTANGNCTLREAIRAANEDAPVDACPGGSGPDTILLASGTYQLSLGPGGENAALTGDLDITSDISILGAGAAPTVVDGARIDRVFQVAPSMETATVTLSDLTVRGGKGTGAGIWNAATLTMLRTIVTDNEAGDGSAGIVNRDTGILSVADTTISSNVVPGEGGGGGLGLSGTTSLVNVTVSGNSAGGNGGGILVSSGATADLNNVTIVGNTSNRDGNDVGAGGGISSQGTVTMRNSILAGNIDNTGASPDCESITSQGHNIIGNGTGCTVTPTTGDQIGTGAAPIDPKLGPLADNGGPTPTQALLAGSPAIDKGDPSPVGSGSTSCAATDQRGAPRNCDIGAYELVLCSGVIVNRVGTAGDDTLLGTTGIDAFLAQGGNDTASGLGGPDAACMGDGNDTAAGGGGKDKLLGEGGKDTLKGQGGKDRLKGGPGKDTCTGGGGKDKGTCEKEKKIP